MGLDMNAILKQAQKIQEKMKKVQEDLANERIEHSAGGGMVKCIVSGAGEVLSISIHPDALSEGHEMLEDMVLVAVREAMIKAQNLQHERMQGLTGGLNIPGIGF